MFLAGFPVSNGNGKSEEMSVGLLLCPPAALDAPGPTPERPDKAEDGRADSDKTEDVCAEELLCKGLSQAVMQSIIAAAKYPANQAFMQNIKYKKIEWRFRHSSYSRSITSPRLPIRGSNGCQIRLYWGNQVFC